MVKKLNIIHLKSKNLDQNIDFFVTINDILYGNDIAENFKILFISDYQRPFCWEEETINKLMEDIAKCDNSNYHFTGILYFGRSQSTDMNQGKSIIDGQQRIIFFFLLLYHLKNDNNFSISVKIDNNYFDLEKILSGHYIDNNLIKQYYDSMRKALNKIESYFDKNDRIVKDVFINNLLKKIYFLIIVCNDNKIERSIFIDINARSVQLDDCDKIKAYILTKYYKNDLTYFIKCWTILNKKGKNSIAMFFRILLNALKGSLHTGKVKYNKLLEVIDKERINEEKFKLEFSKALERFQNTPFDSEEIFDVKKNISGKIYDLYASIYLSDRLEIKRRFYQEITNKDRYEDYRIGRKNPIILFLLFILTFICETNFSFKNAESQRKIDDFMKLGEEERKQEVKKMWEKCKNDNFKALEDIEYKINGINDHYDRIIEKTKCIYPLLIFANSQNFNFYENIANCKKINFCHDHIIPKILLTKNPIPRKDRGQDFIFKLPDEKLKKMIRSFYNIRLSSSQANSHKSSNLDKCFCILDDEGKVKQIDYQKIVSFLEEKKIKIINDLENIINKLCTKK